MLIFLFCDVFQYHPDVIRVENERPDIFKEIKAAYEVIFFVRFVSWLAWVMIIDMLIMIRS